MFREALKLLQSPRNFWNFDQESTLRPEKSMGISPPDYKHVFVVSCDSWTH